MHPYFSAGCSRKGFTALFGGFGCSRKGFPALFEGFGCSRKGFTALFEGFGHFPHRCSREVSALALILP